MSMTRREMARMLVGERKTRRLTLEDVAEKAGYSYDHLYKAECGLRTPGFEAMSAWAGSLGFDLVLQRKPGA